MTNPYLLALDDPDYNGDKGAKAVDNSFEPFRRYLDNAEQALKKKEVSCGWTYLIEYKVVLELEQPIYEIKPQTHIEFQTLDASWYAITKDLDEDCPLNDEFEPDFDDPVSIGKGKLRKKIAITSSQFKSAGNQFFIQLDHESLTDDVEKISWSGYSLAVNQVPQQLPETMVLTQQGREYSAKRLSAKKYILDGIADDSKPLIYDGKQQLRFNLISKEQTVEDSFDINGTQYIVASKKPKLKYATVKDANQSFIKNISITDLCDANGGQIPNSWSLSYINGKLLLDTQGELYADYYQPCAFPQIKFVCKNSDSQEKWIQLTSLDQADDTGTGQDPLEYFFDDQVDILDKNEKPGANAGYRVLKSKPDERQLVLCRKNDSKRTPIIPKYKQLKVKANTQALWRQKEAITKLKLAPAISQKPLLDLLKSRDKKAWPNFGETYQDDINWRILTNEDFDGCDKQREFVVKALNTPDFAILDGPPGTGKTTTILELIIQLVRQGKRILLTASTHAAINNVLERIDKNQLSNEVFPLRVGDENRAVGVENYQYDNLKSDFSKAVDITSCDQLMVDSSNLVCGTTMGILRLFNSDKVDIDSVASAFDVMIIDECSKTTFAEFLVPARYAKKWILVGDVKQLSPFTDREQITANLKQLVLQHRNKKQEEILLSPQIQNACFLLHGLRSNKDGQWGYHDKLIMPVTQGDLVALADEMKARASMQRDEFDDVCLVGGSDGCDWINTLSEVDLLDESWRLYYCNLIFCEKGLLEKYQDYMPADAVILSDGWRTSAHNFRHMARFEGTHSFSKDELSYSYEVHEKWHNKKSCWADEIVWRLERQYWLRFLQSKPTSKSNKLKDLEKQLKQLLPKSVKNVEYRVYNIRNMAFPSILEALSGSGILKQTNDLETTLNQGFRDSEKSYRHATLTYQHRMHPDISRYPREQFYSEGRNALSLFDGKQTRSDREWNYKGYNSHAVWLDVDGVTKGNANEKEASHIIYELKKFCDWSDNQNEKYDVAILTFYKKQEEMLRKKLRNISPNNKRAYARFNYKNVAIKLNTVDFFQGQEADLVFLSMVNTHRDGFLDSPNRLNVSVTRARFQLVVVGKHSYFSKKTASNELEKLANVLPVVKEGTCK